LRRADVRLIRVVDKPASDPAAHPLRLDEQAVEFARTAGRLQQDREADDDAVMLGDAHEARCDLDATSMSI